MPVPAANSNPHDQHFENDVKYNDITNEIKIVPITWKP